MSLGMYPQKKIIPFLQGVCFGVVVCISGTQVYEYLQSVDSKLEDGVLQSIEHSERLNQAKKQRVIILERDGYKIAGILTIDQSQRVWILLNPRQNGKLKKIFRQPSDYSIDREEYSRLIECVDQENDVLLDELYRHLVD